MLFCLVSDTKKNMRHFLCRHVLIPLHYNSYSLAPKNVFFFTPHPKRRKEAETEAPQSKTVHLLFHERARFSLWRKKDGKRKEAKQLVLVWGYTTVRLLSVKKSIDSFFMTQNIPTGLSKRWPPQNNRSLSLNVHIAPNKNHVHTDVLPDT